jgi:hypothetical protein
LAQGGLCYGRFFSFCGGYYERLAESIQRVYPDRNRRRNKNKLKEEKETEYEYFEESDLRIQQYWIDLLYSLTEDDLKLKITEINELRKMPVIAFFQYLNTFENRLDKKIEDLNKLKNSHGRK